MNKKSALAQAILLTDEILELLESGDFAQVNKIEIKRKPLIEQAFMESIEKIDLIKAHHLRNLNQQVLDKLGLFKQSVVLQQQRLRNASRATHAYLKTDSVPK